MSSPCITSKAATSSRKIPGGVGFSSSAAWMFCIFPIAIGITGCHLNEDAGGPKSAARELSEAIYQSDLQMIDRIVLAHPSVVNEKLGDRTIEYPIQIAAYHGKEEVIEYLTSHGANINVVSEAEEQTPLMMAISRGNEPAAIQLTILGADTGIKDKSGKSACQLSKEKSMFAVSQNIAGCQGPLTTSR